VDLNVELPIRHAVEVAEQFADGEGSLATLHAAEAEAQAYSAGSFLAAGVGVATADVWRAARFESSVGARRYGLPLTAQAAQVLDESSLERSRIEECRRQCDILRDLFGNPFQPVFLTAKWLTPDVVSIARALRCRGLRPSAYLRTDSSS
jgi:hypothetical protein